MVNLVTMHVLIKLLSSCLSRYAQVNKNGDCYDICYSSTVYKFLSEVMFGAEKVEIKQKLLVLSDHNSRTH